MLSELRNSEERYAGNSQQAAVGINFFVAFDGKFLQCNQRFAEIIGCSQDETLGMNSSSSPRPRIGPKVKHAETWQPGPRAGHLGTTLSSARTAA